MGKPPSRRGRAAPRRKGGPPRKRIAISRLRDDTVEAPNLDSEPESQVEDEESEEEEEEEEVDQELAQAALKPQPFNAYKSLLDSLRSEKSANLARKRKTDTDPTDGTGSDKTAAKEKKKGKAKQNLNDDVLAEDEDILDDDDDELAIDQADGLDEDPPVNIDGPDSDEAPTIPFNAHVNPNPDHATRYIQAAKDGKFTSKIVPSSTGGKFIVYAAEESSSNPTKSAGPTPQSLGLKSKIANSPTGRAVFAKPTPHDTELIDHIFNYRDVLYGNRTVANAARLRNIVSVQTMNHVLKTRDRVLRSNEKVSRQAEADGAATMADESDDFRDQGFTRPKVLVLMETRNCCAKWVDAMMGAVEPDQQENKKRFTEAFVDTEQTIPVDRPDDFRELFEGNDDNDFRLGIKFTRKTVKFFSQFYQSDVIMASPLGLRRTIEHPSKSKKEDYDFLSSIEILVIDQGDAIVMQNWEHVEYILSRMNQQPQQSHGCDFSRVRSWYLDGNASHFRQTIAMSAFITPELNGSIFNQHMRNFAGKVKYKSHYKGLIESAAMGLNFKQTFSRFSSKTPWDDSDDRFEYFKSAVLPWIGRVNRASSRSSPLGLLLFVPVYADWLRIRNHFAFSNDPVTQSIPYGLISEYTEPPDVQRARAHFQDGRISVIIYSGRAHHFRRYNLHGVKRVLMYGLPDNPRFYSEMTEGFIGRSISEGKADPNLSCSSHALFSQWDVLKLERVVGSDRVREMVAESKSKSFEFV